MGQEKYTGTFELWYILKFPTLLLNLGKTKEN